MSRPIDRPAVSSRPRPGLLPRLGIALAALDRDRICWLVLGAAMAIYATVAMWLTRGTALFVDGVDLFVNARGLDPGSLIRPLNGHLVLIERAIYGGGLQLFGPNFVIFRLIEIAGASLAGVLLFVLLRRRIGAPAALAPTLVFLFLGSAWEVNLVADVMTNVYCVAAGIGAFLALDRADRRGDVVACFLLILAVACWTLGVAFAIGAAVRIMLERGRWRRLWVFATPLALYGMWLLWVRLYYEPAHGETQRLALSNLWLLPKLIPEYAAALCSAVSGVGYLFRSSTDPFKVFAIGVVPGAPIATLVAIALVLVVRRRGSSGRLWAAVAALLVFWIALALSSKLGRGPSTARYVYPGAALSFVIAAEAFRGIRISRGALAAAFAAAAFPLWANVSMMREGATFFREYSARQRGQLTAVELARDQVNRNFTIPALLGIGGTAAGGYLSAVARNGSPAFTPAELQRQPEDVKKIADATLVSAERIDLAAPGSAPPGLDCRTARPGSSARLAVGPPALLVLRTSGSATVVVRRFADTAAPIGTVSAERRAIRFPPDHYGGPWYVGVTPVGGRVTVCS